MDSHHYIGTIYNGNNHRNRSGKLSHDAIVDILSRFDVQCLGTKLHQFTDDDSEQVGFTATFTLAESHIAIHTWPEYGVCELDVYLCNFLRDNRDRCKAIFDQICEWFEPFDLDIDVVKRRMPEMVGAR